MSATPICPATPTVSASLSALMVSPAALTFDRAVPEPEIWLVALFFTCDQTTEPFTL